MYGSEVVIFGIIFGFGLGSLILMLTINTVLLVAKKLLSLEDGKTELKLKNIIEPPLADEMSEAGGWYYSLDYLKSIVCQLECENIDTSEEEVEAMLKVVFKK
jgi:hypothetical protein